MKRTLQFIFLASCLFSSIFCGCGTGADEGGPTSGSNTSGPPVNPPANQPSYATLSSVTQDKSQYPRVATIILGCDDAYTSYVPLNATGASDMQYRRQGGILTITFSYTSFQTSALTLRATKDGISRNDVYYVNLEPAVAPPNAPWDYEAVCQTKPDGYHRWVNSWWNIQHDPNRPNETSEVLVKNIRVYYWRGGQKHFLGESNYGAYNNEMDWFEWCFTTPKYASIFAPRNDLQDIAFREGCMVINTSNGRNPAPVNPGDTYYVHHGWTLSRFYLPLDAEGIYIEATFRIIGPAKVQFGSDAWTQSSGGLLIEQGMTDWHDEMAGYQLAVYDSLKGQH